jgi:hypothetical protein
MMVEQRLSNAALASMRKDAERTLALKSPVTDEEWWKSLLSIVLELQKQREKELTK